MTVFRVDKRYLRLSTLLVALLLVLIPVQAQDVSLDFTPSGPRNTPFTETFDDASQFTASEAFFSDEDVSSGFDYFGLAGDNPDWGGDTAPGGLQSYTGFNGTYMAGMDLDGEGATLPITIDWTGINISGLSDLEFTGSFAEVQSSNIDASDYIRLYYQIDGGGYQNLLWFSGYDFTGNDEFNGLFYEDPDFNGANVGAVGNALTSTLTPFTATISSTGTTLDLRMEVSVDAGDEDFAVDDFSIFEASSPPPPFTEPFDDDSQFTLTDTNGAITFFSDEDVSSGFDYFGLAGDNPNWGGDTAPGGLQSYTGFNGTYMAGMDLDGEGASLPITIDWTGINISGLSDLEFTGSFAEVQSSNIDALDYIRLYYQIDGGGYQNLLWFSGYDFVGGDDFNGFFYEDPDFNGANVGAVGTALTSTLTPFTATISGTGTTLDLRMEVSVNAGDEDFAVDDFSVQESTPDTTPPTVITFDPADDATNIPISKTLSIIFDEVVQAGTGNITLHLASNNSIVESFDVTSDVSFNSNTVSFTPSSSLIESTTYYVNISGSAITDTATSPNSFAGISTTNAWNFQTDSIKLIHEVQGGPGTYTDNNFNGIFDESPFIGQTVTVQGVVVGDFQETDEFSGFFVQEETADEDGDPATSEGIFVFCDATCTDVSVGNIVTVTGAVDEYFNHTQIDNDNGDLSVTIENAGDNLNLVTAASISFPLTPAASDIDPAPQEAYEGMLVSVSSTMRVTEYFEYGRYSQIRIWNDGSAADRPYQFTQTNAPDVAGFAAAERAFEAHSIFIDDGGTNQNTITKPYPENFLNLTQVDAATYGFRGGDAVSDVYGVLNYARSRGSNGNADWRIHVYDPSSVAPITRADGSTAAVPTFTQDNPRPGTDVPTNLSGSFRVGSVNVLNYFTDIDDGTCGLSAGCRGADDVSEFDRQHNKITQMICGMDADVIGLVEIQNDATDNALDVLINGGTVTNESDASTVTVDGLNTICPTTNGWDYIPTGPVGTDSIRVAFIYDTTTAAPAASTTFEILDDTVANTLGFSAYLPLFDGPDTNRAALAVTFEEIATGAQLTIANNHFKSKGGNGTGNNDDLGDGQGNWNERRTQAAEVLRTWLATNPTGTIDNDVLIIGDLNAYGQEDPITELTSNGYTDLAIDRLGAAAYSYVFDGRWGTLDYALANDSLNSQVTDIAEWHINADEPSALGYDESFDPSYWYENNFYRASDHDPVLIGLDLTPPPPPADTELLVNGDFSAGLQPWGVFGDLDWQLNAGVLEFNRQDPGWQGAILFQSIDQEIPSGSPMQVNLELGNSSAVAKSVQVTLRANDYSEEIACSFTIPANSPLTAVSFEDVTSVNWASAVLVVRVYDQDGLPAVLVDNASVQYKPTSGITGYDCTGYETQENDNLLRNGDFSTPFLREWLLWGDFDFTVDGDTLAFNRSAAATRPAVVFQDVNTQLETGSALQLSIELGNTSAVAKDVRVFVRESSWNDFFFCDFSIPASTPLTAVTVEGTTTSAWGQSVVVVRSDNTDGTPAIVMDNASLVYDSTLTPSACSSPFSAFQPDDLVLAPISAPPYISGEATTFALSGAPNDATIALDCDNDGIFESDNLTCPVDSDTITAQVTLADSSTYTVTITLDIMSITEAIDFIKDEVALLNADGVIDNATANAIITTLDAVAAAIAANDAQTAFDLLYALAQQTPDAALNALLNRLAYTLN